MLISYPTWLTVQHESSREKQILLQSGINYGGVHVLSVKISSEFKTLKRNRIDVSSKQSQQRTPVSHSEMETPYLPQQMFADDFGRVYEPAEDTFLLMDALEEDLQYLDDNVLIGLECGCGSGTVVTALSKALGKTRPRVMMATDISLDACKTSLKCAKLHNQTIQMVNTDLGESLMHRLENQVDLLVFNPPYVPTDRADTPDTSDSNKIALAWAGGDRGRDITDRFLASFVPKLLSKPHGRAYLVALDKNNIRELQDFLVDHRIAGKVVKKRRAGIEHLSVIRYEWSS